MSSETELELRSELTGEIDTSNDLTADDADNSSKSVGVGDEQEEKGKDGDEGALSDDEDGDEDIYEVEKILKMRTYRGKRQFFIRWKNYDASHDTWEPENNLGGAQKLIDEFYESKGTSQDGEVKSSGGGRRSTRGRADSSQQQSTTASPNAGGRKVVLTRRGTSTRQPPTAKPNYAEKEGDGEDEEHEEEVGEEEEEESDRDDEFAPAQKKKKGAKATDKKQKAPSSSSKAIRLVRGNVSSSTTDVGEAKQQNSLGSLVAKRYANLTNKNIPRWIDEGGSSDEDSDKDIIGAALKAAATDTPTPAPAATDKPSSDDSHEKESTPMTQSGKPSLSSKLRQVAGASNSKNEQQMKLPNGDASHDGSKPSEADGLQNGLSNNNAGKKPKEAKNPSSQISFVGFVRDKKTGEILYVSHDENNDQRRVLKESEAVQEDPAALVKFMRSKLRFLPSGDTEIVATEYNASAD